MLPADAAVNIVEGFWHGGGVLSFTLRGNSRHNRLAYLG